MGWRRGRRSIWRDRVVQRLAALVGLGALGWAAVARDLPTAWIVAGLAAALIVLGMIGASGPSGSRAKRKAQRVPAPKWAFPASVAAMAVACFGLALFWPEIRALLARADLPSPVRQGEVVNASFSAGGSPRFDCQVAYVNDGDTLRCTDGTRVRLHAVAARETDETCTPGHPCPAASAAAARAVLQDLAGGKRITCLQTGTSYKRKAAICWTPSGQEINCAMVRSGTALRWEKFDRQVRICRADHVSAAP